MNNSLNKPGSRFSLKATALFLMGINSFLAGAHDIPLNHPREKQMRKECCLEISAEAKSKGIALKGLTIRVYRGTDLIVEISSTEKERMSFSFQENSNYIIVISKTGYVNRSISVDTHLPEAQKLVPVYHYEFELGMLEENHGLDSYYLDFPVALIGFNRKSERFEYNREYSEQIRKGIGEKLPFFSQENPKR